MSNHFQPQSFSILPPVVKNLLIINIIFFLGKASLEASNGIDLNDYLGLHWIGSELFKPYQFVTYMFMHGNFNHLFFNMLAVWMFGAAVENTWGAKRFLSYYLITGFGAAILHYALVFVDIAPTLELVDAILADPTSSNVQTLLASKHFEITPMMNEKLNAFITQYNSADPIQAKQLALSYVSDYKVDYLNLPNIVGASGALFGILTAFGMLFPNSLIYIYFIIPIPAKYMVILYGAIELFGGMYNDPTDNVAHYAHLGGMLVGFLLIKFWYKQKI